MSALHPPPPTQPQLVTPNITYYPDGTFRWVYEYSLLKSPFLFFYLLKIFFLITAVFFALIFFISFSDGDGFWVPLIVSLKVWGLVFGIMAGLLVLAYLLIAALQHGKYCVLFEMNPSGVTHMQIQKQFKKTQVLGFLTAVAGLATGNYSAAGAGVLSAVHRSTHSAFKKVRRIKPLPRYHLIKVNTSDLVHNVVFAEATDFEFVLNYINSHSPASAQRR